MVRRTLLDFFEDITAQRDTFVVHDDGYRVRQMSYAELGQAARAFAARLEAEGIKAGDRIVIWSENRPEWLVAFWGAILHQVVVVPIDFRASSDFVTRIADIVDARCILIGREVTSLDSTRPLWRLDSLTLEVEEQNPEPRTRNLEPGTLNPLVQVVFTSGATAEPKGVNITHRNLLANIVPVEREIRKYRRFERPFHPIRFLNLLPLSHMFGQSMATFVPPMLGGTVIFSHGYSPLEILRQIKTRRVSVLVCVPKVLDVLRAHIERVAPETMAPDPLAGRHWLRRWWYYRRVHRMFGWKFWCVVCGGAPLDPELEGFWRKLGFLVVQGYGLTETAPIVTLNHPFRASRGTVGKPIAGVEVRIADDGEILVRGENVTKEYFASSGDSAASTRAADEAGWFHTGDIGDLDDEGRLVIKGRKKEMIVTAQGLNVFPEDVERAVLAQPGARDAAVVGLSKDGEERVHAVMVLDEGADTRAIVRGANELLQDHQRIWSSSVWPGEALPRTEGTGKLKRREIQRWAAGESGSSAPPPSGASVEDVVARFAGGRDITPDTTMDELGLSSLDRVELMMALEEQFQVTLDESMLAEARTVQELRAVVGSSGPAGSSGASGSAAGSAGSVSGSSGSAGLPAEAPSAKAGRFEFPSWNRRWPSWVLRRVSLPTWILPLARVFMKLRVEGLEHLRDVRGPVIFAANHQSHMDTPAILIALPARWRYRLSPAMAKEFFDAHFHPDRHPRGKRFTRGLLYYLACQFFNAFPLPQREAGARKTMRYMGEVLADGYSVLVFPEGRRVAGEAIAEFRPGIGMMAAKLGAPVVPVRIEGLDAVLHPKMKWPKRGPVRIAFGTPLALSGDDYAALAARVRAAVERM